MGAPIIALLYHVRMKGVCSRVYNNHYGVYSKKSKVLRLCFLFFIIGQSNYLIINIPMFPAPLHVNPCIDLFKITVVLHMIRLECFV